MAPRRAGRDVAAYCAVALVLAASLGLRAEFPILAFGDAIYDDALFVRLADSIASGHWLGHYDNLTLAKGAGFPLFVAVNELTGMPWKVTEHLIYLCSCLSVCIVLARATGMRAALVVCLAAMAFNPLVWNPHVGGRMVREGLYTSLSLVVLALALDAFAAAPPAASARASRWKTVKLALLGFAGATFWLTREEGLWLAPAILVIVACWLLAVLKKPAAGRLRSIAVTLAIPLASFALCVGLVDTINAWRYGVYRNNDFRSADFQAAYGAISRISHANWRRYVVFPRDARQAAYAASPAARELEPFFEGPRGEFWRKVGCEQTGTNPCPEILSGWFMWALRDAVSVAGHYSSATEARSFYLRLAAEINEGCDRGAVACGPPRATLVPPWHAEYAQGSISASAAVLATLVTLGRPAGVTGTIARIVPSSGNAEQLALFERVTNGPIASAADAQRNNWRIRTARRLAHVYEVATPTATVAAMVGWIVLLATSAWSRRWHAGHVLIAALVAAIATRVALLGFLEATSIPSNNVLYLCPVLPMTLALGPCVAFVAFDMWRRWRLERART